MNPFSIAIHGGAGTLLKGQMTPEKEENYRKTLENALSAGFEALNSGKSATDVVSLAVQILEDSSLFNAGKGSVFTAEGTHEMDAAIMEGRDLQAGAVSLVSGIKNPILLARDVMEKSEHVFLAGTGAMNFAKSLGYTLEEAAYFYNELRYQQWQELKGTTHFQLDHSKSRDTKESKFGTVGAVACDKHGNLAAATSTGGMTNKNWGRIGDTSIIGAGNYANNATCAVSCTGSGEFFIRGVAAYDVSCLMEYKGLSLAKAAAEVVHKRLMNIGGDGGLIAVDAQGNVALPFNTEGMYRGLRTSTGKSTIAIYGD